MIKSRSIFIYGIFRISYILNIDKEIYMWIYSKNPRKPSKLTKLAYVAECRKSLRPAPDVYLTINAEANDTVTLLMQSGKAGGTEHLTCRVIPVTWDRTELAEKKEYIRHCVASFKNYVRGIK